MTHDEILIYAMAITWIPAVIGAAIGKRLTNSGLIGFISGVIFGFIGLSISIAIFGVK